MRVVFMGTPEFAARSLERLYSDGHDVAAVFTQPDRRKGRGMKVIFSPVKEVALQHDTPVYQPTSLLDDAVLKTLQDLKCDLIAVVAYGRLLPEAVLEMPSLGCINIHASLLPKYRGAAPIQWAVLNGDTITGVTSMLMAKELDAGDILFTKETDIGEEETSGELTERLALLGAELLSETLNEASHFEDIRKPQNHNEATLAPMITKDLSPIDWTNTTREIKCKVRGLDPWPVATADLQGTVVKVYSVSIEDSVTAAGETVTAGNMTADEAHATVCETTTASGAAAAGERIVAGERIAAGEIIDAGETGIQIACSDGSIIINELQAPGGKRMSAADYLRGRPLCL